MNKVISSEEAIKVSLLYLYQSHKESGMSEEEAKAEVCRFVVESLKKINATNEFKMIEMNDKNSKALKIIYSQIELLIKSPQQHIQSTGRIIADSISALLN